MISDMEKHFQTPVLNQAIVRYLRIELGLCETERKSLPILDCQIYSERPIFQVSDTFYYINCELSPEVKQSLHQTKELLGVETVKGMLVAISRYSFKMEDKWNCIMCIEKITLNKLHEVNFSKQPNPYYTDQIVTQYANLYQQKLEKEMLGTFRNRMVNAYDLVKGPSPNCPLIIKLRGNMDLTEDELNMLIDSLEPEDSGKSKAPKKRKQPEGKLEEFLMPKKTKGE